MNILNPRVNSNISIYLEDVHSVDKARSCLWLKVIAEVRRFSGGGKEGQIGDKVSRRLDLELWEKRPRDLHFLSIVIRSSINRVSYKYDV